MFGENAVTMPVVATHALLQQDCKMPGAQAGMLGR